MILQKKLNLIFFNLLGKIVVEIKCPQCKKSFEYKTSKWRPFCSERCKLIDLGHWVTESYSIPSEKKLNDEDLEKIERSKKDE